MKRLLCACMAALLAAALLAGCTITIQMGGEDGKTAAASGSQTTGPSAALAPKAAEPKTAAPEPQTAGPSAASEARPSEGAFRSVSVKVQAGSLYIRAGETFSFRYRDGSEVPYTVEDGVLLCEASFPHQDGVLTLPAGAEYSLVSLTVGAGHIYAEDILRTGRFVLEVTGGEVSVMDVQASESSEIRVNKGAAYVRGSLGGQVTADCTNGSIRLEPDAPADGYDYEVSVSMGRVGLAGRHYQGRASERIDNGAGRTMTLTCGKGDIEVGAQ